jgi:hypothetical protein
MCPNRNSAIDLMVEKYSHFEIVFDIYEYNNTMKELYYENFRCGKGSSGADSGSESGQDAAGGV